MQHLPVEEVHENSPQVMHEHLSPNSRKKLKLKTVKKEDSKTTVARASDKSEMMNTR